MIGRYAEALVADRSFTRTQLAVRAAARNAWIVAEIDSTAWWVYRYATPLDGQPDGAIQFDEDTGAFEYAMLDGTPVPDLSTFTTLLRKEA